MTPAEIGWLITACVLAVICCGSGLGWWRSATARRRQVADVQALAQAQNRVAAAAVDAERVRIVREMHDVIAHSLAIMIAQADGGSFTVTEQTPAHRAFATIAETGRAALNDTRRILGVLRHGEDSQTDLPAVSDQLQLEDLVRQADHAGLRASLVQLGTPHPVPSAIRLAVFRICQEALTNALKHAGLEAEVIVAVNWRPDGITLTVTSTPSGNPGLADPETRLDAPGLGLAGMRERAALVGGQFEAGPSRNGFQVKVALPFDVAPRPGTIEGAP